MYNVMWQQQQQQHEMREQKTPQRHIDAKNSKTGVRSVRRFVQQNRNMVYQLCGAWKSKAKTQKPESLNFCVIYKRYVSARRTV